MDYRWHWGSISICCLLQPKKWVFGSKKGKFWKFHNFRSGALMRLWRPYYASPRPGGCLWAERTSRRWFWVLNGLCATSGSRDMGRQSFGGWKKWVVQSPFFWELWPSISQLPDMVQSPFSTQNHYLPQLSFDRNKDHLGKPLKTVRRQAKDGLFVCQDGPKSRGPKS